MSSKRIAIAGLGEIGKTVARKLAQGLPGLVLAAITTRDRAKAQAWLDREGIACPLISLDDLPDIKTTVPKFLEQMHATMPAYLLNVSDPEPDSVFVITAYDSSGNESTYSNEVSKSIF
jgi:predicted dehydrogenase